MAQFLGARTAGRIPHRVAALKMNRNRADQSVEKRAMRAAEWKTGERVRLVSDSLFGARGAETGRARV